MSSPALSVPSTATWIWDSGSYKNLDLVATCRYRPRKGKRPQERFRIPEGRSLCRLLCT